MLLANSSNANMREGMLPTTHSWATCKRGSKYQEQGQSATLHPAWTSLQTVFLQWPIWHGHGKMVKGCWDYSHTQTISIGAWGDKCFWPPAKMLSLLFLSTPWRCFTKGYPLNNSQQWTWRFLSHGLTKSHLPSQKHKHSFLTLGLAHLTKMFWVFQLSQYQAKECWSKVGSLFLNKKSITGD